jgi:soluble lytic murein transglycosylase-like protein
MYHAWVSAATAAILVLGGHAWESPARRARAAEYARLIVDEALVRDSGEPPISPITVVALCFAESSMLTRVVGSRGERGLLQIMPHGVVARGRSAEQLADPATNLRLGIAELRRGVRECGGAPGSIARHNLGECPEDPYDVALVRRVAGLRARVRHLVPSRAYEAPEAFPSAAD